MERAGARGHFPSWDLQVARDGAQTMRDACPGLIINQSAGVVGQAYQGPLDCSRATQPKMAACNADSLKQLEGARECRLGLATQGVRQPVGQGEGLHRRDA
ncbi:hypothetical protein [Polaromonas sp.]|uniref:hypothetical protein n=1 Tax=Polaromonas sp. TaxID=1869339 RepID=UPI0025F30A32|nr:hypothetical protein [Polaromonas sp.]